MKIAAITMVYNEPIKLPLWERYYGRLFGEEHTYVIDHGSDDGSTRTLRNRIRIPRETVDDHQRARFVSKLHGSLLEYYDAVLYSDCDEFLIADPESYDDLADYIRRMEAPCATPIGIDLVHLAPEESAIDISRPVLMQRRFVNFACSMCKTLISKRPISWGGGFHTSSLYVPIDSDLYLFHLGFFDRENALSRLRLKRAMPWKDIRGYDRHQRMTDERMGEIFDRFCLMERRNQTDFKFADEVARYEKAIKLNASGKYDSQPMFRGEYLAEVPERFRMML